MVARVNAPGIGLVANPYPAPKAVTGAYTICEVCNDRKIRTLDWHAHKNSKGHRKNEEAMLGKENQLNTGSDSNGNWAGGETSVVDSGGWGSPAGGFGMEGDSGFSNPRSGNGQGARKFNGACYGCGMEGHSKRDCPTSTRGSGCFNCGETGHNKADCPNPRQGGGGGDRTCYGCGQPGHNKADCPNPRQGGAGGGNRQCFNCGEYGHSKADCQNERQLICRNCDGVGHMAKDCTEKKNWDRVTCNNCGNKGHTVKKCKEPIKEETAGGGGDWGNNDAAPAQGDWNNEDTKPTGGWADSGGGEANDNGNGDGDQGWHGDSPAVAEANGCW